MILALTFLAFGPAVNGQFFWDDSLQIPNNPIVKAANGLRRLWFTTEPFDYFPLTYSTFWMEWRLWGNWTAGYHILNLLLHAGTAILLWRVLTRLRVPGAFLAGLIFALHPVNVESAAWITERKNTLSLFLAAASTLFYLRAEDENRRSWYGLSVLLFALAVLAKTSVTPLPIVLLLCAAWRHGQVRRGDLLRSLPLLGIAAILSLVTVFFQYERAIGGDIVRTDGMASRLAGAGWALWFYLGKLLLPINLCFVYPRWTIHPASPLAYVPLALLAIGLAAMWRHRRHGLAPVLFALSAYVLLLLPVLGFLNIYFMKYSLVSDHWQYPACICIIALVIGTATWLLHAFCPRPRLVGWIVALPLVAVLLCLSRREARLYQRPELIWLDTITRNPGAWMAHANYGRLLYDQALKLPDGPDKQAMLKQVDDHYHIALGMAPDEGRVSRGLGMVQEVLGRDDQAMAWYRKSLDSYNRYPRGTLARALAHEPEFQVGQLLAKHGQKTEAMEHYLQAIALCPDDDQAQVNLGVLLAEQGRLGEAMAHYTRALQANPDSVSGHVNLANALYQCGQLAGAVEQYQAALQLEPENPKAHNGTGLILARQGRLREAETEFRRVLQDEPASAEACNNLGIVLAQQGRLPEAIQCYRRALQLKPDFASALRNLTAATGPQPPPNGTNR